MLNSSLELFSSTRLLPPPPLVTADPIAIPGAVGVGVIISTLAFIVMYFFFQKINDLHDGVDVEQGIIGDPTVPPPATYTPLPFILAVRKLIELKTVDGDGYRACEVGPESSRECVICLEDLSLGGRRAPLRSTVLDCQHEYHTECILRWLIRDPRCPVCRKNPQSLYQGAGPGPWF